MSTNKNFHKEFVMGLFLDNDSVCTMNRLVVAVANIVNEHRENLILYNNILKKEFNEVSQVVAKECSASITVTRRIKGFYENSVRNFTDEDYIGRFKMKKSTVQCSGKYSHIFKQIGRHMLIFPAEAWLKTLINFLKNLVTPGSIPLGKKVHVFLWILMTDSSYSEIGRLFGLHKSSVSYIFHEIASHLNEHRYHFINWPSVDEQHVTRIKVNSRFNFPNCVGFIDACRLKVGLKRLKRNKTEILLQAVCDESFMFIDVHIGDIGKTKKIKVFKDSSLAQELKNFVEFENHILGDSEYRLRKNLITPFTSDELLTSEEMKFNEIHWKTRTYIGHAFELLKERFRKLNHIDTAKPESVHLLIMASCILHNFILVHEGSPQVKDEAVTCDNGVIIDTDIVQTAAEKRQFLCNYINYMDMDVN